MQDEWEEDIEDHQGIVDVACGSDFIMCLKDDGNVYGLGFNKSGQLGTGDFKPKEVFTVVENLLGQTVSKIYAGNQHCCCIVESHNSTEKLIREMRTGQINPTSSVLVKGYDGGEITIHQILAQLLFG